jgi:WD40 repeat protein
MEECMKGGYRKSASPAGVRPGDKAKRILRSPVRLLAFGSAVTILSLVGTAFPPNDVQVISLTYSALTSPHRQFCGQPYKVPKPLAPQRVVHDPHSKGIRALAFCPNGSFLTAADGNGHLYVWSMATRTIVTNLQDPASKGVTAVAYRPRTSVVATGDANGSVYLWQAGSRKAPRRLRDPASKGVRALAFSPGGRFLAVADGNGRTFIWSMRRDQIIVTLRVGQQRGVNSVTFGAGGKAIAIGNANGSADVWSLSGNLRARLETTLHDPRSKGVAAVAFVPRTAAIATADANGSAFLWPASGTRPRILTNPQTEGIAAEKFTPNGNFLATADADGHLFFWGLTTDRVVEFLPVRGSGALRAVALNPGTHRIAAGDAKGAIYIADTTRIGIHVALRGAGG